MMTEMFVETRPEWLILLQSHWIWFFIPVMIASYAFAFWGLGYLGSAIPLIVYPPLMACLLFAMGMAPWPMATIIGVIHLAFGIYWYATSQTTA